MLSAGLAVGRLVIGLTIAGSTQRGAGSWEDELTTNMLAQPQAMAAAAADVAGIGSAINDANAAAAGPTTGVLGAAAD